MASGFVVSSQARVTSNFAVASISRVLSTKCRNSLISSQLCSSRAPSNRFFCECSHLQDPIDLIKYKEVFSRRMAMAGLKPHHRIALGVSGGPDSMALCILTADWKTNGLNTAGESRGFIDGLLAIIVDHGLRAESKDEANIVRHRVSDMGIRCEIAQCDWLDGKPKQGHLQEAAREMRYQIFQNVCIQHQIGVLLVAHHADDQAELFILRLSRDSGVLGLAGMAFASQLFSTYTNYFDEASDNYSILLVRPLLEFSKEDLYKICEGGNQEWVEDPTNQNPSFARNRIRLSLRNLPSCTFKYELQAVISACRKTRAYVDQICSNLINEAASVMAGYAVIDLEILHPSKIEDICLSKFIALVLQFISQRHRPVRGSTSKLLLDYIRTFPCKTSLTAAGCYLCAAPRSKGTKLLVCCSVNSPLPSKMELFYRHCYETHKHYIPSEVEQIIVDGKANSDNLVPDASDVQFLDVASSESILVEAKRRNILSESTYSNILSLQEDETKHFKSKTKTISDHDLKMHGVHTVSTSLSLPLQPGQICYFMNRFLVSWNLSNKISGDKSPVEEASCNRDLAGKSLHHFCRHCMVGHDMVAEVRHMVDADWLYLAKLSKHQNLENHEKERVILASAMEQISEKTILCSDFARLSAERALHSLKSIPVAARRSLPVLINSHGLLLSIPSICFRHCPYLMVSAVFKPRVPLGGGHSSFL
ncbi:uncharacterized protein LOC117925045 isoform X2 [Vitis riparia]|uniref:uncharacterized protein LOC117925045 isoform X2 n=1 Tax=Vitis riparia TaxID=96939 RepID=UPI00155B0FEF|nr:uncharacterized protein LOC117925045 isoform X2 [Vitis riparia]